MRLRNDETRNDVLKLILKQALRVSSDSYGSDTMSAHYMATGYTRTLDPCKFPAIVPDYIATAHDVLTAKRKFMRILRSKTFEYLVQFFIKTIMRNVDVGLLQKRVI